tara:strand:+ start:13444 stop:15192 length:1749 start_codon:yes stop_codon:yes gene_type:complete
MSVNKHIIEVQTRGADKSKKQLKGVSSGLKNMAKQAGIAAAAYFGSQALLGAIKSSIELFGKQEEAEKKLRFAAGAATNELIKQAEAIQRNSRFGDEAVIAQQAYVKSLGISTEQTKEIISASVDLAAAMNISLESAVMNTTKTLSGMQGELGEKLPAAFKELTPEALKAGEGIKFIAEQFGGTAQADAESMTGQLEQMRNAVGDAGEAFGALLAPAITASAQALKGLAEATTDALTFFDRLESAYNQQFEIVDKVAKNTNELIESYKTLDKIQTLQKIQDLGLGYEELDKTTLAAKISSGELLGELLGVGSIMQLTTSDGEHLTQGLTHQDKLLQTLVEHYMNTATGLTHMEKTQLQFNIAQQESLDKQEREIEMMDIFLETQHAKGEMLDVLTSKQKENIAAREEATAAEEQARIGMQQSARTMVSDMQIIAQEYPKAQKAAKAAAIGMTIFDTYRSAQGAYNSFVSSPQALTNPILYQALGIAAATTSVVAGLARVQSIRKAQYGADFVTDGPQMMMVGEGSGPERVQVTPLSDPNIDGPQGQGIVLNIQGNILHESFVEDNIIPQIREGLRLGENMGI